MIKPKHILLIDDDQDDVVFFQEALLQLPFATTFTFETDCERALEMLRDKFILPDIICLDFNMPKKNGRECAIEIRQMPGYRNMTILLWTTALPSHEEKEIQEAGVQDVFLKPNSVEELVNRLIANLQLIPVI